MKTILITGINGYLGSLLLKRYSKDYKIVGLEYTLDNLFRIDKENYDLYSSKNGILIIYFKNIKLTELFTQQLFMEEIKNRIVKCVIQILICLNINRKGNKKDVNYLLIQIQY